MKDMEEINGTIIRRNPALSIATAPSRLTAKWANKAVAWSELARRCSQTKRTGESVAEWEAMSKDARGRIKDVGGFVGGRLKDGVRRKGCVLGRSLLTLDIDFGTAGFWDDFAKSHQCAALCYTTHSSTPEAPRYRLVSPLSREVTTDEYEPVARAFADTIGMDLFDDTTYQPERLFYWPSTSRDGAFEYHVQDGQPVDPDALLKRYAGRWQDSALWPRSSREAASPARLPLPEAGRGEPLPLTQRQGRAEDPLMKRGIVGAFCRAYYPISKAIEAFLPDVYAKAGKDRYTYRAGSTTGGAVVYDGRWLYSNHDTDPARGMLLNAFDLVRVHRFGGMDAGRAFSEPSEAPSCKAMSALADGDPAVRSQVARDRAAEAEKDFEGVTEFQFQLGSI